jgi:formamidopyrimidine-DNA glycosylase
MDPEVIAGIGNIYSDEALWHAKINPFKEVSEIKKKEAQVLYKKIQYVLKGGLDLGGESFADYRNIDGEKGRFDDEKEAYRREGEKCSRCGTIITRKKIGGRSTCFCPSCQKLK